MLHHNEDIDRMLSVLGIDTNMQSDPAIIEDILVNDMLLGDFEPARQLLGNALGEPVSLAPMFEELFAASTPSSLRCRISSPLRWNPALSSRPAKRALRKSSGPCIICTCSTSSR